MTRALQAADEGTFELEAVVAALSSHYTVVIGPKQLVRRVRLDTFDRRLRAAGLTLEHQIVAAGELLLLRREDGPSSVAATVKDMRWPALAEVLPVRSGPGGHRSRDRNPRADSDVRREAAATAVGAAEQ